MMSASTPSIPPTSLEGPALRAALMSHRAGLIRRLEAGEDGIQLGHANARFLNACFRLLFEGATRRSGLPSGIALAAVGSFGRGAVALHSDADVVLVIASHVSAEEAAAVAEALLYPLWDAGLAVGHQILNAGDTPSLAREDLATATALLDMRLLAGEEGLLRALLIATGEGLFGEDGLNSFIDRLEAESAARHERFGGSLYLLEPDVKSAPGGLRDLDGIRWAARARYRVVEGGSDPRFGVWGGLVRLGVLVGGEAESIASAESLLWRIRNRLHARSSRKTDRLGFEEQEALGAAMGFGDDRARAAERLMQAFYLNARTVTRARASLFDRLRPERPREKPSRAVDLGGGVLLFDAHVTIAESEDLQRDPALAMRAFAACARQNAPILPFARDAITLAARDAVWCERLRASAEAGALFVELVCTVPETRSGRGSVVGELHDVGLLLAMVPEFLPVVGRVHHDIYHVYTVDVHSVAAVDRLRQLARGELANDFPLASRLAAEIAHPRPLFLATLLHDIGKGWPQASGSTKNHSRSGAEACERILTRLGVSREDVDEARELVLDHLLMYNVATRRDLQDTTTIEEFARSLRGREGLRNLYLLTMADVSTTSPAAMTSWKARMLEELYFAAEEHMASRGERADAVRIAQVRHTVRASWLGPTEALDALLDALPERYFLASAPESIVQHARVVSARGNRPSHVALVSSRHRAAAELCVVATDRPGLLSGIAAVITANRLEVLTAEVYSHPVGAEREALDLFWVRDHDGGTEGVVHTLPRLVSDLAEVCSGRVSPADLLRTRLGSSSPWRERASPAVPTEVDFDNRASPRHTIVDVYARDRPGLLYTLAHALYGVGLSIALSKINTEGARVADVFYVRENDGSKVAPGARQDEVREAIVQAVRDGQGC
jgi:[protein-PII] uridylyltransferase